MTYSGYNAATPTTPGHVFEVRENGSATGSGIFTNLNVESGTNAYPTPFYDGDLPVSDVVRDDATHTLYVATDFGVLRGDERRARRLARDGGHASLRGHAPRDPAVQPRADVHGRRPLQRGPLRSDALAGHLEDEPGGPRPRTRSLALPVTLSRTGPPRAAPFVFLRFRREGLAHPGSGPSRGLRRLHLGKRRQLLRLGGCAASSSAPSSRAPGGACPSQEEPCSIPASGMTLHFSRGGPEHRRDDGREWPLPRTAPRRPLRGRRPAAAQAQARLEVESSSSAASTSP